MNEYGLTKLVERTVGYNAKSLIVGKEYKDLLIKIKETNPTLSLKIDTYFLQI